MLSNRLRMSMTVSASIQEAEKDQADYPIEADVLCRVSLLKTNQNVPPFARIGVSSMIAAMKRKPTNTSTGGGRLWAELNFCGQLSGAIAERFRCSDPDT